MTKKKILGLVVTTVFMITMVGNSIAGTATGVTSGGYLGKTSYRFTTSICRQAYGSNASFYAKCEHRVENIKICISI